LNYICITAAVRTVKDNILAAKRAKGKHLAGYWEFPGGKIEPGESSVQCLKGELKEEFTIDSAIESYFIYNLSIN